MGEALCQGAVPRVVLEPVRDHNVQGAVSVGVLAREQDALLRLYELDRCSQHEGAHVVVCEAPGRFVHVLQLRAKLVIPLALGTPRLLETTKENPLLGAGLLCPAQRALQALALGAVTFGLLAGTVGERFELALGGTQRVFAFGGVPRRPTG